MDARYLPSTHHAHPVAGASMVLAISPTTSSPTAAAAQAGPAPTAVPGQRRVYEDPYRVQPRKLTPKWLYATPLVFAPLLPLIRINFRRNPKLRDRLFFGTVGVALVHGILLMTNTYAVQQPMAQKYRASTN